MFRSYWSSSGILSLLSCFHLTIKILRMFRNLLSIPFYFLCFVDRASRYKFLLITNLKHFFVYFFYFISLRVSNITMLIIRRSNCINTSSGMISLCKWLLGMPVLTGIPSSHLHRLFIPDEELIKFDLLMMSTVMLETCREIK